MKGKLLLTCEHAGNVIPKEWRKRFLAPKAVLESHRGIDIGAKGLSLYLEKKLKCPFFLYENTRLLIELNRSLHHPKLFSEFSKKFTKEEKKTLIDTYYTPYRTLVEKEIKKINPVIHLSIHSFTPVMDGKTREVEIGLLYDPKRSNEKHFCKELQRELKKNLPTAYRVKLNKPYHGKADGFTTHLRKRFSNQKYLGIEIEVNQKLFASKKEELIIRKALEQSIQSTLATLGALWSKN